MLPTLRSRGSPSKGTKSKVATSPMPSCGPMSGHKCYTTRAFSGVPIKRDNIRKGYLTPAFSGAQMRVELLCNTLSGCKCYVTLAFSGSPAKGTKSEAVASPARSRRPT